MRHGRALRLGALLVLLAVCAAAAVARRGWWATGEVAYRGVHPGVETVDGVGLHRLREFGKVELPDPGWRPLLVQLRVAPAPGAPQGRSRAVFAIDDEPVHHAEVGPGPTTVEFVVRGPVGRVGVLGVQVTSEAFDEAGRGVAVAAGRVAPVVGAAPILRAALPGLVVGVLLWWAWFGGDLARRHTPGASDDGASTPLRPRAAAVWREALLAGVVAASLFGAWAVLKPPLQAPDESQHLVRVLAAPNVAWLHPNSRVPVDLPACNPLLDVPFPLSKLPFHEEARLTRGDVTALRAVPWPATAGQVAIHTQAWAYPPGFYHAVAAIGTPASGAVGATPYQATYVHRFVVAGLAAACWAWVMVALARTGLPRRQRWLAVGLCLANPMAAFVAGSVNPDALAMPLIVLALVHGHAAIVHRRSRGALFVALVLAALVKPTALVAMAALAATAVLLVATGRLRWQEACDGLRPVVAAAAVCYVAVYLWVPVAFYNTPRDWGLLEYVEQVVTYRWRRWVGFWGTLGWLDYQAPDPYYVVLLVLLALNVALALPGLVDDWRRRGVRAFLVVASVVLVGGVLAGEYANLHRAGLTFQGRYVLPAMVGVASGLMHRARVARWAFVAALIALHLALAQRTVPRYFTDTATWCASLPWGAGPCPPGDAAPSVPVPPVEPTACRPPSR